MAPTTKRSRRSLALSLIGSAALVGCGEGMLDDGTPAWIEAGEQLFAPASVEAHERVMSAAARGFILAEERASLARHSRHRENRHGASPLEMRSCLKDVARRWARELADRGRLVHNPDLARDVEARCALRWQQLGENIGVTYAGDDGRTAERSLFQAWLASPPHHANIDYRGYRLAGIGAYRQGELLWMVVNFADPR